MKKFFLCLLMPVLFFTSTLFSQNKTYRIGIFSPMYLDSAFTHNKLRSEKAIPKFVVPGLEFVQGAMIALDSLDMNDARIEAFIYDVKSATEPLSTLIKNKKLDSLDLMIGAVKDMDYKMLADFALRKNIPFISSIYPNDGGIVSNPFVAIVNSTLKAHCEAIYNYIVQKHGTEKIYIVKKSGTQEDRVYDYFKKMNDRETLLTFNTITADSVTSTLLKNKLDSNFKTVLIGASLDEDFVKTIANAAFPLHNTYNITLIGMPNWDGFKYFFKKGAYKDMPIFYTTPHYNSGNNFENYLTGEYNRLYKSNPADMVYKGFENVYYFANLLMKYPNELMSHLNDRSLTVFHEFNFRPVNVGKRNAVPDYFENKHLYLIKMLNGTVSREW